MKMILQYVYLEGEDAMIKAKSSVRSRSRLERFLRSLSFLRICAIVIALIPSLPAYAALLSFGADSWKEEVLLHDGRKLIVERTLTYHGRSEPGQSAPIGEQIIRFTLPSSDKTVTWISEYSEEIGRANFNLLAVHLLDDIPYIVAEPNLCPSYNKWGRPNPPYVLFKYQDDRWQRISMDELPVEFKTINVVLYLGRYQVKNLMSMGLVSSEKIEELNKTIPLPELRKILRDPLSKEICHRYPGSPKAPGN
jgi:hypothetical protein